MKRLYIIILILIEWTIWSEEGFFLQGRTGTLIKVDIESGLTPKGLVKKGPNLREIKDSYSSNEFEELIQKKLDFEIEKIFFKEIYQYDESTDSYNIDKDYIIKEFSSFLIRDNILININQHEKKFLSYYQLDRKKNIYKIKEKFLDNEIIKDISHGIKKLIVRNVLLHYNSQNEIYSGIDDSGMPMPHRFPRTFDTKTKGAFDIHFVWGYRFENNITLGFSINLTNIVMPSLEIMLKYNFVIDSYPFEPYVGGIIYGGFLDGFPIGLSAIGGMDFYPRYYEDDKNFYLSAELRMGAVLYSKIYFDTGDDTEGIWKKFSILAEGGFYFGAGYRWDR